LIINNEIQIKWSNKIKKYYINKGYIFTKIGDNFKIHINDLPDNSHFKIDIRCDNCNKLITNVIKSALEILHKYNII
jgi:outer membrane protein assembly factor BamA